GQDRVDRREVGRAAGAAVAGPAGGDALRLVAREERAAGVAGLGADRGADEAVHAALRVGDGGVVGLDGAAVPARGGTGAAHVRADRCLGGAGDRDGATVVVVDRADGVVVGAGPD